MSKSSYNCCSHALLHAFNELLPLAPTPSQELEQRSKFFMLLGLHGLSYDYSYVRDQILGSLIVPNFTSTCSTLLRVPSPFSSHCAPDGSHQVLTLVNARGQVGTQAPQS